MNRVVILIAGVLASGIIAGFLIIPVFIEAEEREEQRQLFEECIESGGRLVDTVDPRQCQFPSGVVVTEP